MPETVEEIEAAERAAAKKKAAKPAPPKDEDAFPHPDELPDPDERFGQDYVDSLPDRQKLKRERRLKKPKDPRDLIPAVPPWPRPPEAPTDLKPTCVAVTVYVDERGLYAHAAMLNIVDGKIVGVEVGEHELRPIALDHANDCLNNIFSRPALDPWLPNGKKGGRW